MKNFLSHLFKGLFLLSVFILLSCSRESDPPFYRNLDFNADWKFYRGEVEGASDPAYNDSNWLAVHLPHDWSIMDAPEQDSLHDGPFYRHFPKGEDVAYMGRGVGWYRKVFVSPGDVESKRFRINFDGVQSHMELWVNGQRIGDHAYGYTPFYFDISPALKPAGEENLIAVKTWNPGENSRWFAGAGIYREVTMHKLNPISFASWGVFIHSSQSSPESAEVSVEIHVENHGPSPHRITCMAELSSPSGEKIILQDASADVDAGSAADLSMEGRVENPEIWTLDQPRLYLAKIEVHAQGELCDSYTSNFGIRQIDFSPDKGFLLNGEPVLMKGACVHHDHGLLGAAAFPDAEQRRVRIMKEKGYNAIRTSHNPPSSAFLDACDELGILVIDEAFDQWLKPKRPHDYSKDFREWHIRDIQAMVLRDRNHPSVIMWSFGNEIQERADPEGIAIAKKLIAAIREMDETRPVTQAVCDFWDNPGLSWEDTEAAFALQDVCGYNYQYQRYASDHDLFPERVMYGSESVPQHAWENWQMVLRHPYVIGDFVWTGWDYMGESGIGHHYLAGRESQEAWPGLRPWPWYVSWCGDIDLTGREKAQSYFRDVLWGERHLALMVAAPVPEGMEERISFWGWPNELPSWNWEGYQGQLMRVRVFSSEPEVRLELNGEPVGSRQLDSTDRHIAEFELPYEPGLLQAISGRDGVDLHREILRTSGPFTQLQLRTEQKEIYADPNSLIFVRVQAQDSSGHEICTGTAGLEVELRGPCVLQAAGNGSPFLQGSFTDARFELFRGNGLVIIRSTGEPGTIEIKLATQDPDFPDPVRAQLQIAAR